MSYTNERFRWKLNRLYQHNLLKSAVAYLLSRFSWLLLSIKSKLKPASAARVGALISWGWI